MESKRYNRYKWAGLIAFALMYGLVYVSRFNVNNLMGDLSGDLNFGSLTPKIRKRARKRCKRLIFLSNFWFLYCVF